MFLTIGIPVYNGEKYIEQTICSILKANFNWSEVEVIVFDNNSSDKTCEIVSSFSQIKLFKQGHNLGFDSNVNCIFKEAQGKYVWTIGADDILITDNVSEITRLSDSRVEYSVIFAGEATLQKCTDSVFDAEDFLRVTHFRSGFISNNIINKNLWLNSKPEQFLGSGWIHYGVILRVLKLAPAYVLSRNYVSEIEETKHSKTWNAQGRGLLIGLNLVEIFDKMEGWGYSRKMLRRCKMVIKGAYPKMLLYSKAIGLKVDVFVLKRFIRLYYEFVSFWLLDIWILLLPNFLIKKPFSIYKRIKCRE